MQIFTDASDALRAVQSKQTLFIHGAAATPVVLLKALVARADELRDVELVHLHTMGYCDYADTKYRESFRVTNLFIGGNLRRKLNYASVDYLPIFLSEIPKLFRSGKKKIDVALISVSPPDAHGFCSLGPSVDVARAAVDSAELVIAQINRGLPRTHGEGLIHVSCIHSAIEVDEPLPILKAETIGPIEARIGELVASLVEDGSTLQAGIGAIPDAALQALKSHRHLGLHTEMWSDHALDLVECGAVDNSRKVLHPGVSVAAFAYGSERVYAALHDNPGFVMLPADEVNSAGKICLNPKVVAINSAVEIDLTGQICADSVGARIISGVGGQMDFMRGAALSDGGKPIIAIRSRTKNGQSKLVPVLTRGAGVVTTRAHAHYVVTEYGIADLFGKTIHERAKALLEIAHPEDREALEQAWRDVYCSALS